MSKQRPFGNATKSHLHWKRAVRTGRMKAFAMLWEVEQKFRLADVQAAEAKLAQLGAQFDDSIEQVDRYFNHPACDFSQTDEALRLRQVGAENFITYKGPRVDATTKTRQELELPLPPCQHAFDQFAIL